MKFAILWRDMMAAAEKMQKTMPKPQASKRTIL
jgi:hypothetical protein